MKLHNRINLQAYRKICLFESTIFITKEKE